MSTVNGFMDFQAIGQTFFVQNLLGLGVQSRLVFLKRQDVIATGFDNLLGDIFLTSHRIYGDDGPL